MTDVFLVRLSSHPDVAISGFDDDGVFGPLARDDETAIGRSRLCEIVVASEEIGGRRGVLLVWRDGALAVRHNLHGFHDIDVSGGDRRVRLTSAREPYEAVVHDGDTIELRVPRRGLLLAVRVVRGTRQQAADAVRGC